MRFAGQNERICNQRPTESREILKRARAKTCVATLLDFPRDAG
jgi:hypothetical protein